MTRSGARFRLVFLFAAACALLLSAASSQAFPSKADKDHPRSGGDWQSLLRQNQADEAEPICKKLMENPDKAKKIEGYKCMANVILFQNKTIRGSKDQGTQAQHQGWTEEGANQAIEQLEKAMKLAPKDLSLFQMRLFVLSRSGQMEKLPDALRASLEQYAGPEALDHWLSFSREFWDAQQFAIGMEYLEILGDKYPENPKILGNLAAFAARLNKMDMALEYAHKAAEMQPENPRFQWNLASLYEQQGQVEKADAQFQKALPLFQNKETQDAAWCSYGMFVQKVLKDEERAQEIITKHCKKGTPKLQ